MAKELLTDAKVRTATFERDGHYLRDGGGLRIRLMPRSRTGERGARLAEYHFKVKDAEGTYRHGALHLGTIGEPFTDDNDATRPFTLADARKARDAARELVAKGIDPRESRRLERIEKVEAQRQRLIELESRRTVAEAFDQWRLLYLEAKNKDGTFAHRKDGGQFVADLFARHVLPRVGTTPLEELRRADVADLLDRLTAAGKRRTANMALSLLRQFLRWCAARDWIENDPTGLLTARNVGGRTAPRERALSTLEIIELRDKLPALPDYLRSVVWLLLATGARVGELAGARKADFDLEAGEWHIPETKNGNPHLIHLSDFAISKVRALLAAPRRKSRAQDRAGASEWLIPGRDPDFPISPKLVAKLIGDRQRDVPLKGRAKDAGALMLAGGRWTPHDLRRTMASRMQDLGVAPHVIEKCLNHALEGIAATYQTSDLFPERREAFERWGAELDRLQTVEAGNVTEMRPRKSRARAA